MNLKVEYNLIIENSLTEGRFNVWQIIELNLAELALIFCRVVYLKLDYDNCIGT